MNHCHFSGFFTHDPELECTENGVAYLNFELVTYSYRRAKSTGEKTKIATYLQFEAYDSGAETIAKLASHGTKITIHASARNYAKDDIGVIFRVNEFDLTCSNG